MLRGLDNLPIARLNLMASHAKFNLAFSFLLLAWVFKPSPLLPEAYASDISSLPPNLDPTAPSTLNNATAARTSGQTTSVLLTFTVQFMDGQPVPAAFAQLVSNAGLSQSNATLSDGSCSFWIDPMQSYNLSLSGQGSKLSGGPIKLRNPVAIVPSDLWIHEGTCNFGVITIHFTSFCEGTSVIGNSREGFAAGSGDINALQTLQVPNQTCTWILGPFGDSTTVMLSIQSLDLTSGDSLTIYGQTQDGKPQLTVLQVGPGFSTGSMPYMRVEIPAPQATIVFISGPGPDALSYGFQMYYQADRTNDMGQLLTLSLVWVGGGLVILLAVLVLVWILRRRQRQLAREPESSFLSWDRLQANASAVPDSHDHDVMVVKLPGHGPHRLSLPQLVWKDLSRESKGSSAAERNERAVSMDTHISEPSKALKPLRPEGPESGIRSGSFLQLAESRPGCGRKEHAVREDPLEDSDSCAICLEKYELGVMLRPLPCKHAFHTACIDTWLKRDPSCPLCKRPLHRPAIRVKSCSDAGQRANESETCMAPASGRAPSSTGLENGRTGTAADLEAGEDRQHRNGVRPDEGSLDEAYERAEREQRADRQRPPNSAWYLQQWLGWGW